MVTKKIHAFNLSVNKEASNGDISAHISYQVEAVEDSTLKKEGIISIPNDNAKLLTLIDAVETLIKNQENI